MLVALHRLQLPKPGLGQQQSLESVRSKHFCFSAGLRGLPTVLVAARGTPPIALLLPVSRRDPPDVHFKRESVAMRAHVRQSDPP